MMNKYKVALWEEVSGFIEVEAESKEKAEELAEELMDNYSVEKILYPDDAILSLNGYKGKHTHGDREVLSVEEIN